MTNALQSSPSVIKQEERRKQSWSGDFLNSSGSPVRDDSFACMVTLSKIIESAGIISPACNKITPQIRFNIQTTVIKL